MYFSLKKICDINVWSHLSNKNETKWSKKNLFAFSAPTNLQYESL